VRVEERPAGPLKLGVILPQTGTADLTQYGALIREGIELALQEHSARRGVAVELVLKDDAGDPAAASRAASALEAEGAIAILGPLLRETFGAAAANRGSSDLLILSPTASETPDSATHAYSLNANDTRGASALAAWAVAAGHTRLAVMYATTPEDAAEARAFVSEAGRRNAQIVAQLPFDAGTTTFSDPIERLKQTQAQAVFVSAPESSIRQLAPQIRYFGLTGVQILGTEAWVSDAVLLRVAPAALEGVVAATPLLESSRETGWQDFVQLYERTQRRTLSSPYPALGYDAAKLLLLEIEKGRTSRRELADALASVQEYRGATGVLSISGGQVMRRPFLVRIRSGKPEPLPSAGG
jgi:branched-chain amino acid transport system substrate-binding protein